MVATDDVWGCNVAVDTRYSTMLVSIWVRIVDLQQKVYLTKKFQVFFFWNISEKLQAGTTGT